MMDKVVGPECPKCGCQQSEQLDERLRSTFARRPGSTQLVIVSEELQSTRRCDHCREQFKLTITNHAPPPTSAELQCHFCHSRDVRELSATRPTRKGTIYKQCKCRACGRRFSHTQSQPAAVPSSPRASSPASLLQADCGR